MKLKTSSLKRMLLASTVVLVPAASAFAQDQDEGPLDDVEEIVVQGQFIPDEKRSTSEISNVLDPEDFQRTGDGDVAVALKRVTGLSLFQGKFVFVRGLGERYTTVLLDRSFFPSTDPLRKVVALDNFPTSLIGNVLVQKTSSAQYPGEFAGGVLDIRTKKVPDEFIFEASFGGEYNTVSTFEDGITYDSPDIEFTTFGGSARNIPDGLAETPLDSQVDPNIALQLPNVFSAEEEPNHPNGSFSLTVGDSFDTGDEGRFGILASVTYNAEIVNKNGERATFNAAGNPTTEIRAAACEQEGVDIELCGRVNTEQTFELGGILALGYEINANHALSLTSTVLRQAVKEAIIQTGRFADDLEGIRSRTRIDFIESQVWATQATGDHTFSLFGDSDTFLDTNVNWRFNFSRTDRDAPLRREFEYEFERNLQAFRLSPQSGRTETSFGALDDESYEVGFDVIQPMTVADIPVDFKFGGTYFDKDRSTAFRRFIFEFPGGNTNELRELVPEIIFGPANIGPGGGITLSDSTDGTDFSSSGLEVYSGYAQIDAQITPLLRVSAGLRYEESEQTADTFERTGQNPAPINIVQDSDYLLPSATITYELFENFQVRAGFSQTINRPDLRELSNAFFIDPERDTLIAGNPGNPIDTDGDGVFDSLDGTGLVPAEIDNFDLRFEYYFGVGDSATLGLFYKDFTNPIERSFSTQGEVPFRTFTNAESAELYGIEFEIEKFLDFQSWFGWDWLGDRLFSVKANGALIDSDITLPPDTIATSLNRRLQGQSDVLANLQFGFTDEYSGEQATIVLNYTGDRIFEVGLNGAADIIEEPPILLDLIYKRQVFSFGESPVEMTISAQNLLDDDFILLQGGGVNEQYDIGLTFGINFGYKY